MVNLTQLALRYGLPLIVCLMPAALLGQCLPPGAPFQASQGEPTASTQGTLQSAADSAPSVVFVDASGSMRGYAEHSSPGFATVYRFLPGILSDIGADASITYLRVGDGIDPDPLPTAFFELPLSPVFYCPPGMEHHLPSQGSAARNYADTRCVGKYTKFNQTSRIDQAIAQIATLPPSTLAIITTDLFVSGRDLNDYELAFRANVGGILRNGRAAEIIGIDATYNGYIFELPSYPNNSEFGPLHNGSRPFFILVFGPPAKVRAFDRDLTGELRNSGAQWRTVSFDPEQPQAAPGTMVIPARDVEQQQFVDDDLRASRALQATIDALPVAQRFPIIALPPPSSRKWQETGKWRPLDVALAFPGGSELPRTPGRIELGRQDTFMFTERGKNCVGAWARVWIHPERDGPLADVQQGKSGNWSVELFQTRSLLSDFEQANREGQFFLFRVPIRWIPTPLLSTKTTQSAQALGLASYGFQPEEEANVLRRLMVKQGGDIRGGSGTPLPRRTAGMFPAMNLPELLATMQRVEDGIMQANPSRPVVIGYFVALFRLTRY